MGLAYYVGVAQVEALWLSAGNGAYTLTLAAAAEASGLIYVNVLTTANPEGEVRGQLLEL